MRPKIILFILFGILSSVSAWAQVFNVTVVKKESCSGSNSGSISITVDNTTTTASPYGYTIIGINTGFFNSGTLSLGVPTLINNLAPDNYFVNVTDNDNSVANYSSFQLIGTVTSISGISTTLVDNSDQTCLTPNGSITINAVNGGSGSYSFAWTSPGFTSSSQNITNLKGGAYTVVVTDLVANCTFTSSPFTIADPLPSTFTIAILDATLCDGENLTVTINPTIPTNGIQYTLYDGGTAVGTTITWPTNQIVFSGLSSGLHNNIRVEGKLPASICAPIFNSNGPQAVNVSSPPTAATLTLVGPSPICEGASSSIQANITGGAAPYSFTVTGHGPVTGYNGSPITVTPAVTTNYSFGTDITDNNGCTFTGTGSFNVVVIPKPTITLTAIAPICEGTTTADLGYTATTGSPNEYRIDWDPTANLAGIADVTLTPLPASPIVITGLPSTVTATTTFNGTLFVRNASGCEDLPGTSISVTISPIPTITAGAIAPVCFGTNGSLSYSAITGSPTQYRIDWDATANGAGLADVGLTALPGSPISISGLPNVTVPTTFDGTLFVSNTGNCESTPGQAISITVNPVPLPPSVTFTPVTYCVGDPLTTSPVVDTPVGTSTYTWYSDAALTTVLTTGTTPTNAQLGFSTASANATTVYVTEKNASNCESPATSITLTVTALPAAPAVTFTSTYCEGKPITPPVITTPVGTSTYTWYSDLSLTTILTTGATPTNAQLGFSSVAVNTTTVYVTETAGSCQSPATTVTLTVNPTPVAPSVTFTPVTYCVGDPLTTSPVVNTPVGTSTYTWYSDATLTTVLTTSTTPTNAQLGFSTASANITTVYVTEKNATSCESPATTLILTVTALPAAPAITFTPTTYCVGDPLTAPVITTPVGTSTYTWYSDVALTTILTTGATPTNAQLGFSTAAANTTTVYVTEKAGSCESLATLVTITVSPAPSAPLVTFTPTTYCVGDPLTAPVITTPVGTSTYTWYSDVALTTILTTGATPTNAQLGFSTAAANTTTVYVTEKAGGCESPATVVTITVSPAPSAPLVTFTPTTYCVGDPLTAPVITTPVGTSTYTWYSDVALTTILTTGATPTNAQLGFSTAASNTTTVYVTEMAGGCESPATAVIITVSPAPAAPTVTFTPATYCVGDPITTSPVVTAPVGTSTYTWYSDLALTIILTTGTSPTNAQLGFSSAAANTTTVYVTQKAGTCESPATAVTLTVDSPVAPAVTFTPPTYCVGDAINAPSITTPVGTSTYTWYSNAALTTVLTTGTTPTNAQLGFSSAAVNTTTVYVTEKVGSCESPATTIILTVGTTPAAPSVTFTPATYCVGQAIATSPAVTTPVGTSTYTWYSDAALTTALTTGATPTNVQLGFSSAIANTTTVYVTEKVGSCESPATLVTLTVDSPVAPSVTFTPITYCVGDPITTSPVVDTPVGTSTYTWYSNSGLTTILTTGTTPTNAQLGFSTASANATTVYVTETNASSCESPATTVTITVTALPTAPSITFTPATYCVGDAISTSPTVDIPVGTSTYTWYSDIALTTALTTGIAPTNAQLGFSTAAANTTTVYVTEKAGSCESSATAVTLTVSPTPAIAPSVTFTPATYCVGETIATSPVVNAPVGTSTYTWYSDLALTNILITGSAPTNAQLGFSSAAANTTTVYVTEKAGACESPATAVTLTVSSPSAPSVTFTPAAYCVGDLITTSPTIDTPIGTSTYTWYSDVALTTTLTTGAAPTNAQLGFSSVAANSTTVYVTETVGSCESTATLVTLTVNPIPTAPTVTFTPAAYCEGKPLTASPFITTPVGTSTYTWYSDAGLTTPLITGASPTNAQLGFSSAAANITTVYVTESAGTCEGPATAVTLTVNPAPVAPVVTFDPTPICIGSAITAPVITTPVGTSTYTWYSDAALTTALTTGTAPTNAQLGFSSAAANVTTVYVTETNATTCEGLATSVTLSVSDIPTAVLSGNAAICQGTSTDLTLVLTGIGPWDVSYSDGSSTFSITNITSSPRSITVSPTAGTTTYSLVSVTNAACGAGTVSGTPSVAVTAIGGDEITFGINTWIGYVYTNAAAPSPPLSNIDFASSKYRGYIDETDIAGLGTSSYNTTTDSFDLNVGNSIPLSGPNVCGSYLENYSIRFKMTKVFAAGEYRFTVGGDDGVRLFRDVSGTLTPITLSPSGSFNPHSYTTYTSGIVCLSGSEDLVLEYYEQSGFSRVSFNYTYGVPLVDAIAPVSACVNQTPAPTLTANSTTPGVTVTGYNWYTDATLLNKVATTAAYTPSAAELDLTTANTTTFYATASYSCGEGPSTAVVVNVINSVNTTLTVTPTIDPVCSGGASDIRITTSEAGVSYQLINDSDNSLVGSAVVGTGGDINLSTGALTTTTTFRISGTAGTCSVVLTTKPTVNVSGIVNAGLLIDPVDFNVCESTGTNIQVFNSENGVTYQLRNDADDSVIGTTVAGTGGTILLPTGNLSTVSFVMFNVLASNGTCSIELTEKDSVKIDTNPDISLTVDSDVTGTLCIGGLANITVDLSEAGVSYQLRDDADDSLIGSAVVGNGAKINLPTGALSVTTTFNVLATNGACTPVELTATKTINVAGSIALNLSVTPVDAVVCTGSATTIEIANSEVGVTYQLRNEADDSLIGAVVAGTGSTTIPLSLPTGNLTTLPSITFNVLASSVTCSAELTNKTTVTVGTNPDATLAVTVPPATLCVNGSTSVTVVSSETGVSYQLRNDADDSLIGSAVVGTGADLPLPTGSLAATISFNVLATSGACAPVELNNTVTVNVGGTIADNLVVTANTSSICSGTATTINVAGSDATVTYQLRDNTNALIGAALAGNGGILNLPTGNLTATTTFNVLASNGTCSIQLTATASVTITAAPDSSLGVTAQNSILCTTNTGTNIRVANSETGVPYQLRDGTTNIGTSVTGTGATIDLPTGNLTATTTFNVFAGTGTCSVQLAATVTVTIISTPAINLAVTAQSATLCTTNTGTNIRVANSENGVSYQLRDGAINIGTPVTGTGTTIDLPTGTLSATTAFNVFASVGTCSAQLTATATVTVTSTPDISIGVTAQSATLCTTNTGTNIQVANSQTGASYQLRDGVANVGAPVNGTGGTINLPTGTLTATTTFNVFASLGATCSAQLTATATVTVTSTPDITLGVTAQNPIVCTTNTGTNIQVANSQTGASYQLRDGVTNVGATVNGTGGTINLPTGTLTATTTFNVLASLGATCSAQLTATATVTVTSGPDISLAVTASSGSVCANTGTNIQVANSENGASYQLRNGTTAVGAAVTGTGGTINLPTGSLTANTTFNVFVTIGTCTAQLTATAGVTILPGTDPSCSGGACATVIITPVPSPATCSNSDGSVTFNINPVIPGIRIDIQGTSPGNNTITRTNFNNPVFPSIPVGVYDYTVEYGGAGCLKTGTFTIDQSGTVGTPVATNIVGPLCAGGSDGSLKLDVPNETGNLLEWSLDGIIWNPFTAGNIISGIPAGPSPTFQRVISVRKTPADACFGAVTIVINDQSNQVPVLAAQQPKTICSGSSTAYEILLTPLNLPIGTTFNWPDPDGAGPATAGVNVPMGVAGTVHINDVLTNTTASSILVTYVITPQLSSGCTGTAKSVVFTVRSNTDPLCNGGTCASVVITPVPTAAQCTLSNGAINFTINPAIPIVNNTGVKITITGVSTTNNTIARTNFNNPSFAALPIGVYNYSIEYGDVSCLKTGQVTIDQSGTVGTPAASNIVGPQCAGSSTGAVTLNVPGETGNILEWSLDGVLWSSFTAGSQITGIPAGAAPSFQRVISVRRSSTDPCNAAVTITIQDRFTPITASITPQVAATCNNNDGSVLVAYSGGDATGYTFELDGKSFVMPTDKIIRNLSGGNHILKVIDNQLCSITLSGTQFAVTSPGLVLFKQLNISDPSCNTSDRTITVLFPPGQNEVAITQDEDRSTPVFKDVLPANGVNDGESVFPNLSKGRYYITVKSKVNGCPNEITVDVEDGPTPISLDHELICRDNESVLKLSNIVAADASLEIIISKANTIPSQIVKTVPLNYADVIFDGYFVTGTDVDSVKGDYIVQIRQTQGACIITSERITFSYKGLLSAEVTPGSLKSSFIDLPTGAFDVSNFSGGVSPYMISLRFDSAANPAVAAGQEQPFVDVKIKNAEYIYSYNKLDAGRYLVTISDDSGCIYPFNVWVPIDFSFKVENIPNVFTPNGDGVNDFFFVRNLPAGSQLIISNRWGNEVYSSKSYQNDWSGGSTADGIYYYRLKVEGDSAVTGWIEIQRGK